MAHHASTALIKSKYGTLKHYADIQGWSYITLQGVISGAIKGRGVIGAGMIAQMIKDKVWGVKLNN